MAERRIEKFAEAARRFCTAAEASASAPESPAEALSKALVAVYAAALELPDVQPTGDGPLEGPPKPIPPPIEEPLRTRFGDDDAFLTVFDPTEPEPDDPIKSSLAQELGEIYEDLKEALALLARYGPTSDCLWEVRFAFDEHWGRHAMHVLPALHQLRRLR